MIKQKILVTGGAGYIGSVLVPRLLERGYQVRILDKLVYGDFGLAGSLDKIEMIVGDIMNPPLGIMDGISAVIHLAGVSSQAAASYHSPRYTDKINHVGTEIMGGLAKRNGVERFVLASSCSVYCSYKHTPAADARLMTEKDEPPMAGPYALSKRAAEEAVLELKDANFCPVILRKGTLYGFSPKMRYDLVINSFTKDAFSKGKITVNSGGEIFRPMIDIQDVVAAYITALELPADKVSGEIFNVAAENAKIGDLATKFCAVVKSNFGREIELDIRPFEVVFNYKADNSKFVKVFGFKPSRDFADAVLEIWGNLQKGHDFANKKYYNDIWHLEAIRLGII